MKLGNGNYPFHHKFKLPAGLRGDLILLQWYYLTANSWWVLLNTCRDFNFFVPYEILIILVNLFQQAWGIRLLWLAREFLSWKPFYMRSNSSWWPWSSWAGMWVFIWVFLCIVIPYDTSIFFNDVLQTLFLSSFGTVPKLKLGSQTVVTHHLLLDLFPLLYPLQFQLIHQAKDPLRFLARSQHLLMLHLRQLSSQLAFLLQLPSFKIMRLLPQPPHLWTREPRW